MTVLGNISRWSWDFFGMLQDIRVCFRSSFDPHSNSQKAHVAWSKHHGFWSTIPSWTSSGNPTTYDASIAPVAKAVNAHATGAWHLLQKPVAGYNCQNTHGDWLPRTMGISSTLENMGLQPEWQWTSDVGKLQRWGWKDSPDYSACSICQWSRIKS